MPRRIESPSSILAYRQCPRKYYYQYLEHRPTSKNVHTIKGNFVHEVLDEFFQQPPEIKDEIYMEQSVVHMRNLFDKKWNIAKSEFVKIGISLSETRQIYVETLAMVSLWLQNFLIRLVSLNIPMSEAFKQLTPMREQEFVSNNYAVKGYVDVIEQNGNDARIMDYKTSSKPELSEEYKLQLSIYALLYKERYGILPKEVGIYFLKHADDFEKSIVVTDKLINEAKFAIETHHQSTNTDNIVDYPKKEGPLCKWSTGKCDFYELCFSQKV